MWTRHFLWHTHTHTKDHHSHERCSAKCNITNRENIKLQIISEGINQLLAKLNHIKLWASVDVPSHLGASCLIKTVASCVLREKTSAKQDNRQHFIRQGAEPNLLIIIWGKLYNKKLFCLQKLRCCSNRNNMGIPGPVLRQMLEDSFYHWIYFQPTEVEWICSPFNLLDKQLSNINLIRK